MTYVDPIDMLLDGWCEGCDQDISECLLQGRCLGEKEEDEDEQDDSL